MENKLILKYVFKKDLASPHNPSILDPMNFFFPYNQPSPGIFEFLQNSRQW